MTDQPSIMTPRELLLIWLLDQVRHAVASPDQIRPEPEAEAFDAIELPFLGRTFRITVDEIG